MSTVNTPDDIERQLGAADQGQSVTEAELAASRARSLAVMESEAGAEVGSVAWNSEHTRTHTALRATRPRLRRRVLLVSAAAALLVGGVVVGDVVRPGGPGATAEAAEVLNSAAEATIRTSDPVVGPGQYLLVDTKAAYSYGNATVPGEYYTWLVSQDKQLYVPADRSDEWILNQDPSVPIQFFDDTSRRFEEKQRLELEDHGLGPVAAPPFAGIGPLMRAPEGNFYGAEQTIFNGMPLGGALDTAPRYPQTLLEFIYERNGGKGASAEEQAFKTITEALGTGVIPADLRAALYEAAALMPGVTVLDRQATLDGRIGISIGMTQADHLARIEMIIDPDTGLLIGEREVLLEDRAGMPAGATPVWTAITTSVVDTAP